MRLFYIHLPFFTNDFSFCGHKPALAKVTSGNYQAMMHAQRSSLISPDLWQQGQAQRFTPPPHRAPVKFTTEVAVVAPTPLSLLGGAAGTTNVAPVPSKPKGTPLSVALSTGDEQKILPSGDEYETSKHFPVVVHKFIETVSQQHPDIVHWELEGSCFAIDTSGKDDELIPSLLDQWFNHTNIRSLRRNLNAYGFKKSTNGSHKGFWYHPHFSRVSTVQQMRAIKATKRPSAKASTVRSNCVVIKPKRVVVQKQPRFLVVKTCEQEHSPPQKESPPKRAVLHGSLLDNSVSTAGLEQLLFSGENAYDNSSMLPFPFVQSPGPDELSVVVAPNGGLAFLETPLSYHSANEITMSPSSADFAEYLLTPSPVQTMDMDELCFSPPQMHWLDPIGKQSFSTPIKRQDPAFKEQTPVSAAIMAMEQEDQQCAVVRTPEELWSLCSQQAMV